MKVSIIIPVYNVAPYIKRCLYSVAAQTYTGEMDCLLIDDCGTDDSIIIAKQWIQSYKGNIRFIIFYHSTNQGLSAARNTGIEIASGDYVAQWGLSVAGHSMKLSKDQYTAVEEVRYIPYSSHA